MALRFSPPASLLRQMHVPQTLLLGPGPSNCSSKVLSASSQQMLGPLDEDLMQIMEEVKLGIKYAFQTDNVMTFAVSGTGHCAMEAAICNVLEPGDVFLVATSGFWGDRAKEMGQRIGAKCYRMNIEEGHILHLGELEMIISEIKPKVVFFCHGDSSTGIVQPLEGIGDLLKKYDCLSIVDCVASLGAVPLFMDDLGIDIMYSCSQKVLSAPPGLSPISFSTKAVKAIKARKSPVSSFYMDAFLLGNYWNCDEGPVVYHHTAPVSLIYALREALSILATETLQTCWERHKLCATKLYEQLESMGLSLYISEKAFRLPTVTTVKIPAEVNGWDVVNCLRKRFGIAIALNLGSATGNVWRIGLMGSNCNEMNVLYISDSLSSCLKSSSLKSSL